MIHRAAAADGGPAGGVCFVEPDRANLGLLLQQALLNLASSAEHQILWLTKNGLHVDELGLDFDGVFLAWLAHHCGGTSQEDVHILRLIDTRLSQMSGKENHALWTFEGLRESPQWQEVRDLARQSLSPGLFAEEPNGLVPKL